MRRSFRIRIYVHAAAVIVIWGTVHLPPMQVLPLPLWVMGNVRLRYLPRSVPISSEHTRMPPATPPKCVRRPHNCYGIGICIRSIGNVAVGYRLCICIRIIGNVAVAFCFSPKSEERGVLLGARPRG